MLIMNIQSIMYYCRHSGNPYLNRKYAKYVHKFKAVVIIWNLAFILKILMSFFGVTALTLDAKTDEDTNFWYSVETFINIMFTEITPFYFAIDKKIVKIFTLKFLEVRVVDDNNTGGSGS